MQISFSIIDAAYHPLIQKVIKECDLVFIFADSVFSKDHRWVGNEIDIKKCILLTSNLNNSHWIVEYMKLRSEGGDYAHFHNYSSRELSELNTIYESLPRGIPLTLHSFVSMVSNKGGIVITIPYEISFSVASIHASPRIQNIAKKCDLVFIQSFEHLLPRRDHYQLDLEWVESNISQEKCVALQSKLDKSNEVIYYIIKRTEGSKSNNILAYTDEELIELNTIYESLPRGIPLALYSWDCMAYAGAPATVTIPHEN